MTIGKMPVALIVIGVFIIVLLPVVPSDCFRYQVDGCVFTQPPSNGYTCSVNMGLRGDGSISYAIFGFGGAYIQDWFTPFANGAYILSNSDFGGLCVSHHG
jgi:hypothetical protein